MSTIVNLGKDDIEAHRYASVLVTYGVEILPHIGDLYLSFWI
jgi:hypothetical protein